MNLLKHQGNVLAGAEAVSDADRSLLHSGCTLGTPQFADKQAFLKRMHDANFWLGCDCVPDNKAVMGVRHREGYYHLFNLYKRGAHTEACPLYRLPRDDIKGNEDSLRSAGKHRNNYVFHFDKRESTSSESDSISLGGKKATLPENSLWVCLKRVFILSECDLIGGAISADYGARKRALLSAMREIKIGGVSMSKVTFWGLDKHDALCDKVAHMTENKLMPKGAAHGLGIAVIDGIKQTDRGKVHLVEGSHSVALPRSCKVEINGKQGYEQSPPYLAIYTVCNTSEKDEEIICEPQKCFITPIHSKATLLPISTSYDRILIDKALANVAYNQNKGVSIVFQRPLDPLISPISDRYVMPSLLAKHESSFIMIDIDMPATADNKINAAKRIEAMNELGDLVRIPLSDDDAEFEKLAFDAVTTSAKYVLGIGSLKMNEVQNQSRIHP